MNALSKQQTKRLSRSVDYHSWTAKPKRDPKDHKQIAGNEMLVYEWVTDFIGDTPTETLELEFEDSWELCSITSWVSNKEIADALELPVDSVKKAKNLLVKKGWLGQVWFENNNRSGTYKLGISQAPVEKKIGYDRSGKNLPDATYSNIELYNSPSKTNINEESNPTKTGEFKKPKSIDQGKLDELNCLFAEATNQQPTNATKAYWSSLWSAVMRNTRKYIKIKLNRNLTQLAAIDFFKSIIPKMEGKSKLARHPNWFYKTQSNGQHTQPIWGLDFVLSQYQKKFVALDENCRLRQTATQQVSDLAFWGNIELCKRLLENEECYEKEILRMPSKQERQRVKNLQQPIYASKGDFLKQLEEIGRIFLLPLID